MGHRRGRGTGRVIDRVRWTGDTLIDLAGIDTTGRAVQLYQLGDQEDS